MNRKARKGGNMARSSRIQTPFTIGLITLFIAIFSYVGIVNALDISLEPANVEREVGERVLVNIFATSADSLISMGLKVTFDPAFVNVIDIDNKTSKYEDVPNGWVMDADGNPATDGDQYANPPIIVDNTTGYVEMIGGHLVGTSTTGLGLNGSNQNGKVLLGWILFEAVSNGTSDLTVDLAKYHPNQAQTGETFDNFVNLDGSVDEPGNVPAVLGRIAVMEGACQSNLTGPDEIVNFADLSVLKNNFFTSCSTLSPGEMCLGDLNGDGLVNFGDLALMKTDFFRSDCPSSLAPLP